MGIDPERKEQDWVRATDGLRLFAGVLEPRPPAAGTVVITHGMGEHSGRYPHVASALAGAGLRVVGYDLRGHGQSEGRRGALARYRLFLDDLQAVIDRHGVQPLFLYGHSMGAQIVVNYLAKRTPRIAGVILTSPWLRLAFRPPIWKVALARLTEKVWPGFTQTAPHSPANLSRDAGWLASLDHASMVHRRMSARMYVNLTRGARSALGAGPSLKAPLLLMHGEDDPVTSVLATRDFFESVGSGDKTLRLWPDCRHELHNDSDRNEVIGAIVDWTRERARSAVAIQPHD